MNIKEVSAEGLAREVQITVAAADLPRTTMMMMPTRPQSTGTR